MLSEIYRILTSSPSYFPVIYSQFLVVHNLGCCITSFVTFAAFCIVLYNHGSIYGKTGDPTLVGVFKLYWITKVCLTTYNFY